MDAARHKRRNLIQNIAIALLSVSAVLLFAQLQLYNLDTREDSRYLDRLMGTLPADTPTELREFPAPVRVVLTDSYGRYGSLGFTTNSDGFAALGLREALSSVQSLVPVSEDSFRAALSGVSIYFDFLDPLPLSVLTEMIGVEDDRVEKVMEILKDNCAKRTETEIVMPHGTGGIPAWGVGCTPMKVEVGGATLFIIEVAEFKKL